MKKYTFEINKVNRTGLESETISGRKVAVVASSLITGVLLVGFSIGALVGSLSDHPNLLEKTVYSDKFIYKQYAEPFSKKALIVMLKRLHVKNIDIVVAQSAIETSHYSSDVFLENNNLFGMREAKGRVTTATGDNLKHATYEFWQESVIDYAIYQSTYLRGMDHNQYLAYLSANYAENPSYVNLIKKMLKQ